MIVDAREVARKIEVPTLVVHRRNDAIAPFEAAKAAAAIIPGARFVPLEGDNHWPMSDDLTAPAMIRAVRDFLDGE
jgi:pimeloyl-ACP methyl ester carboxylesterase